MKLIVNADDFGYSKAVNLGILEVYKHGVLTSATMMTNMPGVEHAFQLYKENPGLGVGIHLVLSAGKPVNSNVPSLVDDRGYFKKLNVLEKEADIEDIKKEFNSQMEKFTSFGFMPTHIDSHHHIHFDPRILSIVVDMARKYNLPIRQSKKDLEDKGYSDIKSVENFIGKFYGKDLSIDKFIELIELSKDSNTAEMMCHPGYVDKILLDNSSYNVHRTNEVDILTSSKAIEIIKKYNIQLINYKNLN